MHIFLGNSTNRTGREQQRKPTIPSPGNLRKEISSSKPVTTHPPTYPFNTLDSRLTKFSNDCHLFIRFLISRQSHSLVQTGFEFPAILWSQPPECWDYRYMLLHMAPNSNKYPRFLKFQLYLIHLNQHYLVILALLIYPKKLCKRIVFIIISSPRKTGNYHMDQ